MSGSAHGRLSQQNSDYDYQGLAQTSSLPHQQADHIDLTRDRPEPQTASTAPRVFEGVVVKEEEQDVYIPQLPEPVDDDEKPNMDLKPKLEVRCKQ